MTKFEMLKEFYSNSVNYNENVMSELRALLNKSKTSKEGWNRVYDAYKAGSINWHYAIHILTGVFCFLTDEQKEELGIRM